MALRDWTFCLPPLCGCVARPHETEEAGLLKRRCPRCGAGEALSLAALQAAASNANRTKDLRAQFAR